MKRIGITGLCLVAMLATSAMTATTASAKKQPIPVFAQCVKVHENKTGNYRDSRCKVREAGGEYIRTYVGNQKEEIEPGVFCQAVWEQKTGNFAESLCKKPLAGGEFILTQHKGKFSTTSKEGVLETVGEKKVKCSADTSTGEFTGNKTVGKVKVRFTGCETKEIITVKCSSPKLGAGEIETSEIEGEIGYLHSPKEVQSGKNEVGLALWPSSRTATERKNHEFNALFVEFECSGLAKSKVRGAVVGELKPVTKETTEGEGTEGEFSTESELVYKQTKGKQTLTKLEGVEGGVEQVLESSLNGGAFEKSGEETAEKIKTEDAMLLVG